MKPYYILGLDPGIGSCGFALLDTNNHEILEMGSHLFSAPQKEKTHESLAAVRRAARSSRRNNDRTKARQKHCIALLTEAHVVPEDANNKWFQSTKGDLPLLQLRAEGLDRLLSRREFAQILFCLSGRRGYIPHGEGRPSDATSSGDEDSGKVLKAISENKALMAAKNYRTVGEMFYAENGSRNSGGNYSHCVLNSQIVAEVKALFSAQRALGNNIATNELENKYLDNLTWEKSSIDHDARVYSLVGYCSYFPEEKRAARADLSSELCNAYERLNHLRMADADGGEMALTSEQVQKYIEILFAPSVSKGKHAKVTYARIRKDLDLPASIHFKHIPAEREKSTEPYAPIAWRCYRSHGVPQDLLEKFLNNHSLADSVSEALTYASTEDSLRTRLEPLELDETEIGALLRLPFSGKLFKGYGSRSLKALRMLIDAFEDPAVTTLSEAEQACGLFAKRQGDNFPRSNALPSYDAYDTECNNPVVLRAMSRMRRIVNAIVKRYGVPDEIHIELGTELKLPKRVRAEIDKRQRHNEAQNKQYREIAASYLGIEPEAVPRKLVEKLALHEQQNQKDAYSGETIALERLLTEEHYCEIDHVLPFSRTADNTRNNRVLVLSHNNQNKRERTPYEWMTSGEPNAPSWDQFRAHVIANGKYGNKKKYEYLLNESLDEDTQNRFIKRNLNDTRYMSKAVKSYLEDCLLFPDDGLKQHVVAVAGGATGMLRHVWGLNFGKGNTKDRSDDRHHAVDACVIAACSRSAIQAIANATKYGKKPSRLSDSQPWPTFAEDVIEKRKTVVPTRMVSHGVTGRAFEDTNYRFDGVTDDKKKLAILYAKGKSVKKGNVVVGVDGNAHLVDGMAFLRLWLDPNAKKGKGKWYAEPVYYADIPAMRNGSYVPRAAKVFVARRAWENVPDAAMVGTPIVLYRGDVLSVDGCIARYKGFNINTCSLSFEPLVEGQSNSQILTLGKWGSFTNVKVVEEDCLGHCYRSGIVV